MTHLIHVPLDMRAFNRWAGERGLVRRGTFDAGFALHVLLSAMFGKAVLQPFRLFASDRRPLAGLYSYTDADGDALRRVAATAAPPDCLEALDPERVRAKRMPVRFTAGQRLGFDVRVRPVRRLGGAADAGRPGGAGAKRAEVDAFRVRPPAPAAPARQEEGKRGQVYADWLGERYGAAASVERCRLSAFRVTRAVRGDGLGPQGPDATLHGELVVREPDAFARLVRRGVGRHRAYGYGMLLLRPPSSGDRPDTM